MLLDFSLGFFFFKGHSELFSDEVLQPYLQNLNILTDDDRTKVAWAQHILFSLNS